MFGRRRDSRGDASTAPLPALLLGRYEVGPPLGRGATARVLRGTDRNTGKAVALKLFELEEGSRIPNARARFLQEAKLLARIRSPHVVDVIDAGEVDGVPLLVMEYVAGHDLGRWIRRRGPFDPRRTHDLALQLAAGLRAIHEAGVVHRDLKPQNILMTEEGHARITDMGLALRTRESESLVGAPGTQAGLVLGSPGFLAPEVFLGEVATPASDVFALGMILYHAQTGRLPYSDRELRTMLKEAMRGFPPSRFTRLSSGTSVLVRGMLQPKAGDRPALEVVQRRLLRVPPGAVRTRGISSTQALPAPPPATFDAPPVPREVSPPQRGRAAALGALLLAVAGAALAPARSAGAAAGPATPSTRERVDALAPATPRQVFTRLRRYFPGVGVHDLLGRGDGVLTSLVHHRLGEMVRTSAWFASYRALRGTLDATWWARVDDPADRALRRRTARRLADLQVIRFLDRLTGGDGDLLPGLDALLAPVVEVVAHPDRGGNADALPGRPLIPGCQFLTTHPGDGIPITALAFDLAGAKACGPMNTMRFRGSVVHPLPREIRAAPGSLEVHLGFIVPERPSFLEVALLDAGGDVLLEVPLAFPQHVDRFRAPGTIPEYRPGIPLPVTLRFSRGLLAGKAHSVRVRLRNLVTLMQPSHRAETFLAGLRVSRGSLPL